MDNSLLFRSFGSATTIDPSSQKVHCMNSMEIVSIHLGTLKAEKAITLIHTDRLSEIRFNAMKHTRVADEQPKTFNCCLFDH